MNSADPQPDKFGVTEPGVASLANSPVAPLVSAFRQRAGRLRITAFGILGIIFALLVGGATVFVVAPQLTLAALYPQDLDKKSKDIADEMSKLRAEVGTIDASRDAAIRHTEKERYEYYKRELALVGEVLSLPDEPVVAIYFRSDGGLETLTRGALGSHTTVCQGLEFRTWEKCYRIETVKLTALASGLPKLPEMDPQVVLRRGTLRERLNLLEAAELRLKQQKTEQGLAAILDRPSTTDGAKLDGKGDTGRRATDEALISLVQTNVTRFGTIVMIIFLVSILTPLYRYNIRLATYYDARGDVLELLDTKVGSAGFVDLVQALTPSFDFGKAPATPMDQAIELARQILGAKGSDAKKP